MIKYILPIALFSGLLYGCDRTCGQPGQPIYPEIGGCIAGAASGAPGGPCIPAPWGGESTCSTSNLACVAGTCYDCGKPGEACCGTQRTPGSCTTGTCGMAPGDEWYSCLADGTAPPAGNCAPGQTPNFYVYTLSPTCVAQGQAICALDQSSAEAYVNMAFGGVEHGPVTSSSNSAEPWAWYGCGTGASCGVSDGTMASTFFAWTHQQVLNCEQYLDSMCVWVDGNDDGTCPAM